VQRAKLRGAGLEPFLAAVAISGELGVGKPDARAFERTLAMLGCTAAEAVMVGDSLERDIIAARASGIATVWLNRTGEHESTHPHATITSLEELPTALDSLA
jgi:FMN phosphatase YigB (HAD superfamily)